MDFQRKRESLESEVFIQIEHLHLGNNAQWFSSHAAQWIPVLGLGVWPDREPPRSWSREELENVREGEAPRTLMPQLLQISSNGESHWLAAATMLGTGTLLCALAPPPARRMLDQAREFFLPQIKDPEFRVFRSYFPLMNCATIAAAAQQPDQARDWFCGASLYLRESPEDGGVLIVSRHPLAPAFEALGGRRDELQGCWKIGS